MTVKGIINKVTKQLAKLPLKIRLLYSDNRSVDKLTAMRRNELKKPPNVTRQYPEQNRRQSRGLDRRKYHRQYPGQDRRRIMYLVKQ